MRAGGLRISKKGEASVLMVYQVLHACAEELNQKGSDYWNYYRDIAAVMELFSKNDSRVVFKDNELIGTFTLSDSPPWYVQEWDEQPAVYVSAFGVVPRRQGNGYGRKIMQGIEEITAEQGKELVRLNVAEPSLKEYYQDQGFMEAGIINHPGTLYVSLLEKRIIKDEKQ